MPRVSRLAVAALVLAAVSLVLALLMHFVLPHPARQEGSTLLRFLWSFADHALGVTGYGALGIGLLSAIRAATSKGAIRGGGLGCFSMVMAFAAMLIVAAPGLFRSRMAGNEAATIGSLKTVVTQQSLFKQEREVDQDDDGVGEFGYLCELCGEIAARNKKARTPVSPIYISPQFHTGSSAGTGIAQKSGYYYRLYLIGKGGQATDDRACDGNDSKPSTLLDPRTNQAAIDEQEQHFIVYAWPVEVNVTGRRCFFINEIGETYGTKMNNVTYAGTNGPAWNAAFKTKGEPFTISGKDAEGNPDSVDGNIWNPAG
ncbi:MAG: hypothetical protein AB1696_03145 [Planctomycetota bacterium]